MSIGPSTIRLRWTGPAPSKSMNAKSMNAKSMNVRVYFDMRHVRASGARRSIGLFAGKQFLHGRIGGLEMLAHGVEGGMRVPSLDGVEDAHVAIIGFTPFRGPPVPA